MDINTDGSLHDAHVIITGDQNTVEFVVKKLTEFREFDMSYADVSDFDEATSKISISVALINCISEACKGCGYYDHRTANPSARCKLKLRCLKVGNRCESRTVEPVKATQKMAAEIEEPAPKFDELNLAPLHEVPFEEAFENQMIARFRAQICLDDQKSYSLEEMKEIIQNFDSAEKEALDAMYRELMAIPADNRESMINLLAKYGPNDSEWWKHFLASWEL
ncbi:MAG: hypothetical protein ACOYCA_04470 [Eggerthellaceae bacterium]|jgi:hypothetical protein